MRCSNIVAGVAGEWFRTSGMPLRGIRAPSDPRFLEFIFDTDCDILGAAYYGNTAMVDDTEIQKTRQIANAGSRWRLDEIVAGLRNSRDIAHNIRHEGPARRPPSRDALEKVVNSLVEALFPRHYGQFDLDTDNIDYFVGNALNVALNGLLEQVHRGSLFVDGVASEQAHQHAVDLTRAFASRLSETRGLLVSDLRAAFVGDPAATSFPEILIGYPGMTAIIHHRLAHILYGLGATLVARLIAEIAHTRTGIDIHPGASVGPSFFIDHGTGVVIGETAIVGERVRIYQAVTLGARHFPTDHEGRLIKGAARHPVVEDDVIIYAGATILGRIMIGQGSTIGGNVWLTEDVPPNSFVTQATVRSKVTSRQASRS
jgi:serine O-acetyltransferase